MPEELYNTPSNNSGVASGWLAVNGVGQQDQALQGMNEDTKAYIETLPPSERQKAIDEFNAPLSGMEVYEALKQSPDFKPTHEEYTKYLAYDKEHKTSVLEGLGMLGEGMSAVMGDLGKAAGAVIDHPMSGLAKAPASLIEAFAQGTRNLYGMVAQSASPDSVLFKMKNALAGDGTVDGYNQFLEARKFNKHSAALAEGKETLVMDKDVIDHDLTLAMSYIADPTLFIPFGNAASAAMKAVGMGEKIALMGGRAASIKAAVIGGGLKWGVGAPIEALASVTRGTIERGAALGGAVLETTTGISAAELKATAKLSAAGTTTASALGGHIPIISDISNTYVAAGAARGFGEAIGAVGEQIQKQGFNRGYNSFAREAFEQTKGLSPHAKGLLKVLDAVDPMFSYGYGTAVGAGHGALIGGTLGYLNAGEEGMYHGMGAGIALGATGAVGGRMFADVAGGTKMARAEIQGGFVIENMRADKHINLEATELYLELATRNGDRAGALQVIGGLDRVAPDMRLILGNVESQKKLLQSKGLNEHGHKVDPKTGKVEMRNGKPIEYEAPLAGFYGGEGFVMHTDRDGNGKQQVTVVINTDALASGKKNVMHHELFHAVFKTTIMEKMFRDNFAEAILGKFDANGIKVKDSEINPKEFKAFVTRELANTVDPATNKKLAPAELTRRLKEFDYHLAEYQKAGTTAKMNPDSAKALNYLVEEFGAHYATQFMKGKPVDYLFRGAEYTGMQGVMDRLHNGFLDFWQGQTGRQNPTFGDFTAKGFDESFAPNKGKRTLDQRSPALDYMVQDLLRSVAGKRKGSTNSFDVRTMSPEARNAYFNSSGMDGVRAYYDKDGKLRNVTEAQVTAERLEVGKAIHESLSKLDPKETAGLADSDGNFGSSSTLGTKFNDTVLAHLVKEGHISQQLAERIKTVQDIVSGQGSNRVSYLYKGASHETEVGPNSPRLYGKDVPITARETIVVGYKITIKKDGTMSLVMKGLDAKVMDERGNIQWAKPEVRALWQGDRNAFDQSFMEYLSNASKASTDRTRVESSLLPSLAMGDGLGAERRNVMHQFLGMAKRKDAGYFNTPIAEIPRGKTSVVTNFTMDTMSPMRSDSPIRYDFNLDNAHSDLSRNFKVSDMDYEKTPQGDVFTHASKYKIVAVKDQQAHLYDANGKSLGAFKDKDLAGVAMEKAYAAERAETEVRIERIKEDQQKQQQNFKVWDEGTMEEGRRLGDIFETEQGKAFVHGTTLIRQTREEFYSDNFSKLRQADPDTVMAVTEQIAQRGYALRDLRTKAYDRLQAELAKGKGKEYKLARDQYDVIVSHADRYNDILLAYERATRAKTNGQGILDYINTHRRTSTGYDNMAKVFFGDHYDSQFQTGKPVTTVATHGTSSHELLTSREFDPKQSGSKHGAEHDKVGIFLSGETKTSHGYADPKEKDFGYRQVRAAIKFNNPLVVDAQFKCYSPDVYEGYMKKVRDGGHDGVIIKNVYDGGSADTVFIVNNDSVKANTAIIDTHIGMERVKRQSESISDISADSDQGSVRYPIQESMPRGKDVRVGSQLGLSWKVDDANAPKESAQDYSRLKLIRETLPMLIPEIWEKLKKTGRIIKNYDPREILGEVFVINPDAMIAGNVKMGDTTLIGEALGGPNFTMGEGARAGNEVWANTKTAAGTYEKQIADIVDRKINDLNKEARRQKWSKERIDAEIANITTHMVITKGTNQKPLSNPTAFKGASDIIKTFVKESMLSEADVKAMFQKESESTVPKGKDKKTGKFPVDEKGVRLRERYHADVIDFKDIMELPLGEFLAEVGRRAEKSFETRGDLMKDTLKQLAQLPSMKKDAKSLAKMRAMFDDPNFKLNRAENLGEAIATKFSEPYTDGLKTSEAYASVSFKGKAKVVKGSHPDYPYSIVPAGMGEPTFHLWSDAIAIQKLVDKTVVPFEAPSGSPAKYLDMSKLTPAEAGNQLGSNSVGYTKAKMKPLKDIPARPEGEGRIGMNYKVDDIAGAPREGGAKTYTEGNAEWKGQFVGRIAEQNPDKVKGLQIKYIENKTMFKDKNLVTVVLHNEDGQQVGILNADVYKDGTAKIVDTQVAEQFGNRGYSKLMLSELGERIRSQGVKEVYGEVVDKLDRPTKARKSAWGNAELDPESISNMSESGQVTVSKLNPDAHYKVSDAEIAQVQEKVDMLKSIVDRYERFKDAKGRENSDNKRRYWDAKREYNKLNDYTLKPMLAEMQKQTPDTTPNLKPFEGNFKVSDAVKTGVVKLDEIIGRLTKTDNISPSLRDAMKALKDAVRKQDATDEVLIPELREAYDAMVRSIDDQMAGASLTPIDSLKEINKALKPLDKKIQKNSERIQKNARDAQEADMAEGADVESQGIQERQAANRRDMEEGASLESDQSTAEIDRRRGDARLDMEEGANLDSDQVHQQIGEYNADQNEAANVEAAQPRNQNLPPQFPNPAPTVPAGLPSYKPSGTPAFPRPPATPALPQVKPSGAVPFPRPPATPALPRGSIAPPPPQGTPAPNPLAPSLTAAKPLPKLSAWRGWTLEKGLNGGFWKNAVGWMIVVQADKFKVYNPQKAMLGIYQDLEQAKRRVQRAEPKQ